MKNNQKALLKLSLKVIPILSLLFLIHQNSFSQDLKTRLKSIQVEGNKVKDTKIANVFANIASVYKIPIGFQSKSHKMMIVDENEFVETKNEEIIPSTSSVEVIFDDLLKFDSDYKWKIEDEVVIISPTKNADPDIEVILSTKINDFSLIFGNGSMSVGAELISISEVSAGMKKLKLFGFLWDDSTQNAVKEKFQIKNKKVKDVLNDVVKNSKFHFWIITKGEYDQDKRLGIYAQ